MGNGFPDMTSNAWEIKEKKKNKTVAPSNSGGSDQGDHSSKPAWANSS
jgi:hypothetical protein